MHEPRATTQLIKAQLHKLGVACLGHTWEGGLVDSTAQQPSTALLPLEPWTPSCDGELWVHNLVSSLPGGASAGRISGEKLHEEIELVVREPSSEKAIDLLGILTDRGQAIVNWIGEALPSHNGDGLIAALYQDLKQN